MTRVGFYKPYYFLEVTKLWNSLILPRCWPEGKHDGPNTSLSSTLLSGSVLVILAPNWTLSLDDGTSTLKGKILAMPQSILTTLNQSLLKNNLWPPYELLSFFFLSFVQLQLLIWILCTEIFFWLFLVT